MRLAAVLVVLVHVSGCRPSDAPAERGPGAEDRRTNGSAIAGAPGVDTADDVPAPDTDRLRVVFLGTSLTAGLGLARDSERYTDRLQELADSAGLDATMVNAGVSGDTSAGGLRRLDWLLEHPVDVLVVELGANDGLRGQDPDALEENLRTIVRRTRARYPDATIVMVGMEAPPNMGPRYTRRFREVFPAVADELHTELVPFLLDGVAGVPRLNQGDGIHPTAEGHRRVARNVWPVLERVLRTAVEERAEAGGDP